MYVQTLEGLGHAEPTMDVDPAMRLDGHYPLGELPRDALWLTTWLNFQTRGFAVRDPFLEQYIKLALAQRVGTTEEFRKAFCKADHFEFEYKSKPTDKPVKLNVAEVWGYAIVYHYRRGGKPKLWGIRKKGWNLKFVGRSIPVPPFPLCTWVAVPLRSSLQKFLMDLVWELLEEKTDLSREELERLIRKEMESK
jgi:hypothetical protein